MIRTLAALTAAVATTCTIINFNAPTAGLTSSSTVFVSFSSTYASLVNITCVKVIGGVDQTPGPVCLTNILATAAPATNYRRCDCGYMPIGTLPANYKLQATAKYMGNQTSTDPSPTFLVDYRAAYPDLNLTQPMASRPSLLHPVRLAWSPIGSFLGDVQPSCVGLNYTSGVNVTVPCGATRSISTDRSADCPCITLLNNRPYDAYRVLLTAPAADPTIAVYSSAFQITGSYPVITIAEPSGGIFYLGMQMRVSFNVSVGSYGSTTLPSNLLIDLITVDGTSGALSFFQRLGSLVPSAFGTFNATVTLPANATQGGFYVVRVSDASDGSTKGESPVAFRAMMTSPTATPTWSPGFTMSATLTSTGTPSFTPTISTTNTMTASPTPSSASMSPLPAISPSPIPSTPPGSTLILLSPYAFSPPSIDGGNGTDPSPSALPGGMGSNGTNPRSYYFYGVPVSWIAGPGLVNVSIPVSVSVSCTVIYSTVTDPNTRFTALGGTPAVIPVNIGFATVTCVPPPNTLGQVRAYINITGNGVSASSDIFNVIIDQSSPRLAAASIDNAGTSGGLFVTGQTLFLRWVAVNINDNSVRYATAELWKGMRMVSVLARQLDLSLQTASVQIPALSTVADVSSGAGWYVVVRNNGNPSAIVSGTSYFTVTILSSPSRTPVPSPSAAAAPAPKEGLTLVTIIAIAVGGAAVILILILILVCVFKKKKNKLDMDEPDDKEVDEESETGLKMVELPDTFKQRRATGANMTPMRVPAPMVELKTPENSMLPTYGFAISLPTKAVSAPGMPSAMPPMSGGPMHDHFANPAARNAGPAAYAPRPMDMPMMPIINPLTGANMSTATAAAAIPSAASQAPRPLGDDSGKSFRSVRRCSLE